MAVCQCLTLPTLALHSHPTKRPHPTTSLRRCWIRPSHHPSRPTGRRTKQSSSPSSHLRAPSSSSPRRMHTCTSSSWPILDPSTTTFITVASSPMTKTMATMAPTRSRFQPVCPLLPSEGALRRAPQAPAMVLVSPPRGRGR
jgi:hypothetical protein